MPREHERRGEPRIRPPRVVLVDYPELRPQVRDISLAGAKLDEARPLPRGRLVNIQLWLDEQKWISVKAMVRRSDQTTMSVEFLSMSDKDREQLRRFIGASSRTEDLQAR